MMDGGNMMGGYGGGGSIVGGLLMMVFWVAIVVGIILLVVWLARLAGGGYQQSPHTHVHNTTGHGPTGESAIDILNNRYARGEIDKAEYEQKKKDLTG